MAENRTNRDIDTRTQAERPKQWMPAESLPEPDKQEGYAYRWIRVALMNNADPRNISAKMREGWEPVKIEEQPKYQMFADANSKFSGNVEIGGLLLCKTPVEFKQQRDAHYRNQTSAQSDAVDNNLMRESDPRMPLFKERKTSTSFGKGS